MKPSLQLLLRVLVLFFIYSCTKTADNIKLPETKPKLVVGCFLSPQDSLITLTLTRSNPIFGAHHNTINTNDAVPDADVFISDGSQTNKLMYDNGKYTLSQMVLPVVAGKIYTLNISTPDGNSVSATCTVPISNAPALDITFDTTGTNKKIFIHWQDIADETNYYKFFGREQLVNSFSADTSYSWFYYTVADAFGTTGGEMNSEKIMNKNSLAYDFYLLNMDVHYFKYNLSLEKNTNSGLFSQGVPLYSNIKNGLGVFCSLQASHVRIP